MSRGKATGTATSAEALAVDVSRGQVTFQMNDESESVYFGFNEAAVVGEGIGLRKIGDSFQVKSELARGQINIIASGAGGVVGYQTGEVVRVDTGPLLVPAA